MTCSHPKASTTLYVTTEVHTRFWWGGLIKKIPGKPRRRWDNIKVDPQEVGWGGMDWNDLAQDRDRWQAFVSTVMNLQVP